MKRVHQHTTTELHTNSLHLGEEYTIVVQELWSSNQWRIPEQSPEVVEALSLSIESSPSTSR